MNDEDGEMARARQRATEMQARYDAENDAAYEAARAVKAPRSFKGDWTFKPLYTEGAAQTLIGYRVIYDAKLAGMVVVNGDRFTAIGAGGDGDVGPRARDVLAAFTLTGKAG